ncbi:E3 ubiquitin-protein ligase TRIM56-like [Patiria miniata]|uniref:Uncharacterized protein n=1 Tax=Patiria miniata TaxID=46514 RepID=A0A913ZQA4_PATMI|nr:E3 ubiquitin-protein ligase TRIM56-like [Patiria miniata]
MAEAGAKSVLGTISRGHLECTICCCRFTDPKMLDCLHSFCLNCLEELIGSQQPKAGEITCPVCRRVTAVADTGLQGLPNCFFLSSLVDEFNKQERLLGDAPADTGICEQCDEGLEAVLSCLDCSGDICQKCFDAHQKLKSTKKHRIVNLDRSRSQVPLAELRKKDTLQCKKHTNQELCFYCETCKTLACAKCVALDHRTAEHEYSKVADAIRSYRKDVSNILQKFKQSREEFRVTDDALTHERNRLRSMVTQACTEITCNEEEQIEKIRNKARQLRDRVTRIGDERGKKFEEIQKGNRDKMERAELIVATVNDLMQQADDFELLDLKPKVMHNLEFQEEVELQQAKHELSFIAVKCEDVVAQTDLGEILQKEKLELKKKFGIKGRGRDGEFCGGTDVACLRNGDIVVTDSYRYQLMMFTSAGKYKTCGGGEMLTDPWGVAATSDDLLLVTDKKHVKILESDLKGIAVDKKSRIAVADRGRKLIFLLHLDGSLISTIPHDMVNCDLAIGIRDRFIFTNYKESKLICTTCTGKEVYNVNILPAWEQAKPRGVCCDDAGDIYVVVDLEGGVGIFQVLQFSPGGVFIRRVTVELPDGGGMTFSRSGDLVMAGCYIVQIFQWVRASWI